MNVPFLNLKAQHDIIREEIVEAVQKVVEKNAFAGGPFVEEFELKFAEFCGCSHAIGVGSGTDALWTALIALGIGKGDEVITVPNSFIATAEAISFCGATPVFVDIDEKTHTMDPTRFKNAITKRTKAVIPVHMFGRLADMDPIITIARDHLLYVIEDACQAHGARHNGKRAGAFGDAGCFSFYPGKNLGAFGEAGAVVTNDPFLAEKIRVFRDHGQIKKYHHSMIGWNARMDGLQGAVLSVKIDHLDQWNSKRTHNAKIYDALLQEIENVTLPEGSDNGSHVYHIYAARVKNRDNVLEALTQSGIGCGIHYPVPIHLTDAYQALGYKKGSFPVAERCADELISLPMFPDLSEENIKYVARELKRICS